MANEQIRLNKDKREALQKLSDLTDDLSEITALHKEAMEEVNDLLADDAFAALKNDGVEFGSRTAFAIDEEGRMLPYRLHFAVTRKTTWDQEALEGLVRGEPELAHSVVSVKLSISEKQYNRLETEAKDAPVGSALAAVFQQAKEARTTEFSPPRFKVVKD